MWVKESDILRQRIRENLFLALEGVCKRGNVYSAMRLSDYLQKVFCKGNDNLIQERKETVMPPDYSKAVLEILLDSVIKCSEVGENTLTITVHITEPADFRKRCEAALECAIGYLGE